MRSIFALTSFFAVIAGAADLDTFTIKEPLGQTWTDEWITREVKIDTGSRSIDAASLDLQQNGKSVPAQFYKDGGVLSAGQTVSGKFSLTVFFRITLGKNQALSFVVSDMPAERNWTPIKIAGGSVDNGACVVNFDRAQPLPLNSIDGIPLQFAWPESTVPAGVEDQWLESGPVRATLKRTFSFNKPDLRYEIVFTFRAEDPWIDVYDSYALGSGSRIRIDLRGLNANRVYHPYAYNARTFKPGGPEEDSTLQPPQHPIATLGPIWRDIWFNGGPFAFIYNDTAERGIGFAAVRGSLWQSPDGISPESQNLEVHGDREKEGQVFVRLPTDGGTRHWAIICGPVALRKQLVRMTRAHADIPLEKVLREWILEWPSTAPEVKAGTANAYLGGNYNQHVFNPTTLPRSVSKQIPQNGPVKSRDLAVLAYIFSDPNYWPGPRYKWRIGNPNFNTDMYNIYLRIGLLMPEHPHAAQWVQKGIEQTRINVMRDSFPGGAWAESLSYSAFFFHIVDLAASIRASGKGDPFRDWPRMKEVATYLACMHTPVDPRYGSRQKAPIGDTSPGNYIDKLREMGKHYVGIDEPFARQLERFPEKWDGALDLSSRPFYGFGAMLRGNAYDERHESFVTVKAGPARNHFQGDELSFYFASLGVPLAIDYACHYSPRPWSAAIHNRPDMNGQRPVAIASARAFASSPLADVFVADERTTEISQVPMEPHHATKPGWEYPTVRLNEASAWKMRRFCMLVKHDPKKSRIPDYLVVRDEIVSPQPVGWNLHVLGREIVQQGNAFIFPGQLVVDLTAHFLEPAVSDHEKREWGWRDSDSNQRRNLKEKEYEAVNFGAYIPQDFQRGTWGRKGKDSKDPASWQQSGEMGKWLRIKHPAGGSNWLVVLMPNLKGAPAPSIEKLSEISLRVTLAGESEVIELGTAAPNQASIARGDEKTVLLKAQQIKPLDEVQFAPIPAGVDQGAR